MIVRQVTIGNCTLLQGDCIEILPTLGKVDAVVTDPPFGINQDKGMGGGGFSGFGDGKRRGLHVRQYQGDWDKERPPEHAFALMLAAADRHIIWGGQFFADLLPPQGKWLWWDKCQTMPTYGDGELAWTSLSGNAPKKFVYSNNGLMAKEKDRVHPTQKPVAVMEWCLSFLPDAETILDPYMGSGTSGVACVKLGKAFIGIELDEGHFNSAVKRITDAHRQADLFVAKPEPRPVQMSLLGDAK